MTNMILKWKMEDTPSRGKCYCVMHQGQGDNRLGTLLMQVRDEYKRA